MSAGLYGGAGGQGGAAASLLPSSPAPGSGDNAAWLHMAGQLAVQDYLTRVQQAAARDPGQYSALLPGPYDLLNQAGKSDGAVKSSRGNSILDNLKLPSDTEIVKNVKDAGADSALPNIPPGLTIERKKPGRKPLDPNYHLPTNGPMIDKVEITKIPMSNGSSNHHSAPLDMSKSGAGGAGGDNDADAPLNLSMKSDAESCEPPALTVKRKKSVEKELLNNFPSNAKIPSDYYACKLILNSAIFIIIIIMIKIFSAQALSGVFLAEQIRQQQLASELQNHLQNSNSNLTAMQALLSLGNSVNGDSGGKRKVGL